VVRGGHCSGTPAFPCLRECALFILVADVHRRVAPIETSLEWLLLFASHQNVIKFERDARPRLASKPSHQHSNSPCGHCGNRCPKCAADIGAHRLFPARPLNRSFTEPTQGEQPLWVGIDARAMTDRCATRPLAPSLSWRFAEGFNDSPTRRRQPTTAMTVEPECSQLISRRQRLARSHRSHSKPRGPKGSIAPFGTPSSNDGICAFETSERRLEST
jgi:hypothetical protein